MRFHDFGDPLNFIAVKSIFRLVLEDFAAHNLNHKIDSSTLWYPGPSHFSNTELFFSQISHYMT